MKTIEKLFITCILIIFSSPLYTANYHWTGAVSAEFQSASNWVDDAGNIAGDYPHQMDDIFFDKGAQVTYRTITSSSTVHVHSIKCTDSETYTVNIPTMNVYGNILLNGNLTFTGNRTLNMLGATQDTLDLGNATHNIKLVINKPDGEIVSNNHIKIDGYNNTFTCSNGDFTIQDKNISAYGIAFQGSTTARTVTLDNCMLTATSISIGSYSPLPDNSTYNTATCDWRTTTLAVYGYNPFNCRSLTFIGDAILNYGLGGGRWGHVVLNVNTLSIAAPKLQISAGWNTGSSMEINIGELNINAPTNIYTDNKSNALNIDAINENTVSCADRSSIRDVTLNATGSQINTSYISYGGCTFGGAGFETSEASDWGDNTGTITWNGDTGTAYFWRSGTGNWNDPAKWAVGDIDGVSNGCIPTAMDSVYVNPATAGTITLTVSAACREIYWQGAGKGGQLNTANGSVFSVFGNADFSGANSINPTVYFCNAENAGNSFTLNSGAAQLYTANVYFNHLGTYTLTSDFISTARITQNSGNIIAHGINMKVYYLYSINTANVRSLDISGSTIEGTANADNNGGSAIYFNFTNLALDASNSNLIMSSINGYLSMAGTASTPPQFHNVTFEKNGGRLTPLNGASFNSITFNDNGSTGNNLPFSVADLTLSPLKTYTFQNGQIITVTGSLDSRTGLCDVITISGGTGTQKATIKNETGKLMEIPGGILNNIYYDKGNYTENLSVPNGTDKGNNDPSYIDFTARQAQAFYWVGNSGSWTDGNHWAIGNPADTYPATTNPGGCYPAAMDTVYFNGNSFPATGQTVTMDAPASLVSMTWTTEAGAMNPVLKTNAMTVSGFIQLAPGMTVGSNGSSGVSFTGTSQEVDAQKFDTRGVTYQTNFSWSVGYTAGSRLDWYFDTFPVSNFAINNVNFYAHGNIITNGGSSGGTCYITQSPGRVVDISNVTLSGRWYTVTVSECENFLCNGTILKPNDAITFTNNSSCTLNFLACEPTGGYNIISNGTGPVHFGRVKLASGTLSGKIEIDSLSLSTVRGSLTLGATADTVKILESLIYPGTPCDEFTIKSAAAGTQANLQIPACGLVSSYLHIQDINAILPATCDAGDKWTVKGKDLGNNSANIEYEPSYATGENTLPQLTVSCSPYTLTIPGILTGADIRTSRWFKNGAQITANNNAISYSITDDATYRIEVEYNSLGSGCTAAFEIPVAFNDKFTWTGASSTDPTDWNDVNNWDMVSVPDACSQVTIPASLQYYPILVPADPLAQPNPIPAAVCSTIDLEFGGEVKNTHFLTYTSAKVHLTLNSNQWYLFSPPLRNFYPGDIYVQDPNPVQDGYFVETMLFNANNPETGEYNSYNWSGRFNTPDVNMQAGQGMAVWINEHDTDYNEQNPTYFDFPKSDSCHYYYTYGGDPYASTPELDRVYSGRFIYESVIDENTGDVTLSGSPCGVEEKPILVGNPFPTHLNMEEFLNDNADIYDGYKLASGVSAQDGRMKEMISYKKIGGNWYTTDPDLQENLTVEYQMIAPMQSFIVISKTATPVIKANVFSHTVLKPGSTLRSATLAGQSRALGITASRGDDKSKALLLQLDNATSAYRPEEDSYKLFSDSLLASPAVYTRSSDGYALDINSVQDLSRPVPLCLRISEQGAVMLTFSNVETFAANSPLYLHDLKLNRSINLRQQSEYHFIKDDDALYLEDRFLLSATAIATGIEQPEFPQPVIQQTSDGAIFILSGNDTPLRSIQITDAQGRILATEANAAAPYIYKVAAPGIYIVRISGESGAAVKKFIIK